MFGFNLTFSIWDIPALLVLVVIIVIFFVHRYKQKKREEEFEAMLAEKLAKKTLEKEKRQKELKEME